MADIFDFQNDKKAPILLHIRWHFLHDDEGYLSKYTVIDYEGMAAKNSYEDGHVLDVYIKRKV